MSRDPNVKVIFTEDNAHRSYCPSRQAGRPVFYNLVPRDAGCRRGKRKKKVKMPLRILTSNAIQNSRNVRQDKLRY